MEKTNQNSRKIISLITLLWAVMCILIAAFYVGDNRAEAASTGTLTSDYVYFRDAPSGNPIKYNGSDILLRKGQKMTILSTSNKRRMRITYISERHRMEHLSHTEVHLSC